MSGEKPSKAYFRKQKTGISIVVNRSIPITDTEKDTAISRDLDRDVFCLNGLVFDAVSLQQATELLRRANSRDKTYLMSTPNVNFLMSSYRDVEFRDAVLDSDLCVADGMPLIWMARLLGVPLPERVAGSDLFSKLKEPRNDSREPISVFFFGGEEGVGSKACDNLNSQSCGMVCVGSLDPGFVSLEDMSRDDIISKINSSGAGFLVVALGAVKGHIWLERNKNKLHIPLRSHLGAVINFEAGGIIRSPDVVNRLGFEWLWRIKEEPKLWRRYWKDGLELLAMMCTRVLPLVCWNLRMRFLAKTQVEKFSINTELKDNKTIVTMSGYAKCENLPDIRKCFLSVVESDLNTVLNFKNLNYISASVLGTLMMLRKHLKQKNRNLEITEYSDSLRKLIKWHGLDFLLSRGGKTNELSVPGE